MGKYNSWIYLLHIHSCVSLFLCAAFMICSDMGTGNLGFNLPFHNDWEKEKITLILNWVAVVYFWDMWNSNVFLKNMFSI